MKQYNEFSKELKVEGIYRFEETHIFRRYTDEIVKKYPRLEEFDRRSTGARVRFCTDSKKIRIEIRVSSVSVDRGMSFYQANTGYVFSGAYSSSRYRGLLSADNTYESNVISGEFDNDGMNEFTVFLPRNSHTEGFTLFTDDDASVLPPAEHKLSLPFVFYGSSITEQGLTSAPFAYASLLSRFFDADFYNFGASGNAQGEDEVAEYLGGIKKSVFFYDYDHNAPSAEHLERTHERFFMKFREKDPETPVIAASRPSNDTPDFEKRAEIVRRTVENAVKRGDKNVYFLDGKTLFGDTDPALCTTDVTHPNDLGHYMMAKTTEKFIREHSVLK